MNMKSGSSTGEINVLDMVVTVTSMVVGVGILTLPRVIAKTTQASDGWTSILAAGVFMLIAAYILAKLAGLYYTEGFFSFTSRLVSKPVAALLVGILFVYYIMFSAYVIRAIANISKQYLFERTPVEVVALIFLLVLVYSVSGSRIGIIRLNMMFLPVVLFMIGVVLMFSFGIFHFESLKPFFVSDWKGLLVGANNSVLSFLGFELILFYINMMRNPREAPKAVMIGVAIPVMLYIVVYLICVGVFTQSALQEIDYPSIELAKEIQIPGEFFERFEPVFFTIWVMTIFNTACMGIDLAVYNLSSLFPKLPHKKTVFILSPFIYFLSMLAKNVSEFAKMGDYVSYLGLLVGILIPCLLYAVAKIRGVKRI